MFPQSAMLCMVLVLCLMAGPAAGHVSQYSGTAVYTSETNLDGTGSYRGVSESVDNILGPVTCVTTGSFRPAAAGEGSCSAAESGASYFNIRSECEADSLDSPVTITVPDTVACVPNSCYELDTTHNISLARVGCMYTAPLTGTVMGEDLEGSLSGSQQGRFAAVSYDVARRVIVARTELTFAGTADIDFTLREAAPASDANIEVPAEGATMNGIGLISGWSCLGGDLEAEFSDADGVLSTVALPHGVPRGDTESVCGDTNNGFSTTMNWSLLGPGPKTMRLIQNGEMQGEPRNFTVVAFDEEFIRSASGMCTVRDFPTSGDSVTLMWSEPQQSFVVTDIN